MEYSRNQIHADLVRKYSSLVVGVPISNWSDFLFKRLKPCLDLMLSLSDKGDKQAEWKFKVSEFRSSDRIYEMITCQQDYDAREDYYNAEDYTCSDGRRTFHVESFHPDKTDDVDGMHIFRGLKWNLIRGSSYVEDDDAHMMSYCILTYKKEIAQEDFDNFMSEDLTFPPR